MSKTYSTARERLANRAATAPARELAEGRQPMESVLNGASPAPSWRLSLQPVVEPAPLRRTTVNAEQFLAAQPAPAPEVAPTRAPRLN